MGRSKTANRVIVWIGVAFAALRVTVIVVVVGAMLLFGEDTEPPDDGDLAVVRHNIPADENAYTCFAEACAALDCPSDTYNRIDEGISAGVWDTNAIVSLLASNETAISHVEEGLKHERCEVPEITSFDTLLPYVADYRSLARLMALKARMQDRQGNQEEALETALGVVRFGHLIEDCGGGLIHYLVGLAIKGIGLDIVEDVLADYALPADVLRDCARRLAAYGPNVAGLQNVFRVEYLGACSAIDQVSSGKAGLGDLDGSGSSFKVSSVPYIFQPNRTKARFADFYRPLMEEVPRPHSEIEIIDMGLDERVSKWMLLKPNGVGEILVRLIMPAVTAVFDRKAREEVHVHCVSLVLAMTAHEKQEGSLPASLDELVPAYLDLVPRDGYDGKPLRYSRERRIVYSAGQDLQDNGGDASVEEGVRSQDRWHAIDIVFEIPGLGECPE